jgi:DNA-binding beta-propeller fold protein YncE
MSGLFSWPHGLFAAPDGTVWVTDGKNQTVMEFAPDGQVMRTLGKPGVAGAGPDTFTSPSDVLVAPNGDIFVADGHGDYPVPKTNDRMVKFSKDGKFIKAWGHHGSAPGEFDVPHGLAMDSAGRLFVADRANNRIQIFDQDGNFLAEWKQFGRPSGVYIRDDIIYVADSQSDEKTNPLFSQGIPRRLDPSAERSGLTPVILPPGRLRLATRPALTGSAPLTKTIGIDDVAAFAASTGAGPPVAAITAT